MPDTTGQPGDGAQRMMNAYLEEILAKLTQIETNTSLLGNINTLLTAIQRRLDSGVKTEVVPSVPD